MTEITHSKARLLLQAAPDRPLEGEERSVLEAHLHDCEECREYANDLSALESRLQKAFHSTWDGYSPDLSLKAIKKQSPQKVLWNYLFGQTQTIGQVTIVAALLLGYFAIANLVGIDLPITSNETPIALPTPNGLISNSAPSPTPPTQTAITVSTFQACKTILYVVQEKDSLQNIAIQHGTTIEAILEYNVWAKNLEPDKLFAGMELAIPVCDNNPSRTAGIPGKTLTLTPLYGTVLPDHSN
jgi:hypothetical protein